MTPRAIKHRVIYEALQRQIAAGAFSGACQGLLPTERELCQRFGASRPTVARALDHLREQGIIERRRGDGTYLRQEAPLHGGIFGLIGAGLSHTEILGPIGAEIARSAMDHRYRLVHGEAGDAERDAEKLCREFLARGVAGVFLAPLEVVERREAINQRLLASLFTAGIPVVLIDRDALDFPERSRCDLVAIDDVRAACRLARHVLRRGCRRLAFVARPHHPSTTDLRIAGCRAAVDGGDAHLMVRIGDPCDPRFASDLVRKDRCDGVICANDLTAAQLIGTLASRGYAVPGRVRVVGFDDVQLAVRSPVPLTTMRMPCRALGSVAVRMMLDRIKEPGLPVRELLLNAELVVRRSG